MDKRTIIGIVLIVVITLLMPLYQRWIAGDRPPREPVDVQDTLITTRDTTPALPEVKEEMLSEIPVTDTARQDIQTPAVQEGGEIKTIHIENNVVAFSWSTADGGNPTSWELLNYKSFRGGNVDLIRENSLQINFLNSDGREFNLNDYNLYSNFMNGQQVSLTPERPEYEITFYLPVREGRIEKIVRFYYNRYSFDLIVQFRNLQNYVINRKYFVGWKKGLPSTEANISDDLSYSRAYTYMAEELINMDASDKYAEEDFNGRVDWAAIRTKYFLLSLIPSEPAQTNGATIGGVKHEDKIRPEKEFNITIDSRYEPVALYSDTFKVYLGPLDYYILNKYDVELESLVMNKDWYERLFRPISLLIIPAFKFLHRFIPNYGLVIIVFSILIKLVLHPLTKKSYQSMSEMQYLQPKMTEMREKYKDDPQRMNKEMMKLYKEHGVNPLGGCLPMLLQMPVLFALFIVFRSTIQLRGQPFALWIDDLSGPDTLNLGFSLPFFGDSIHVLPILMGITMIWQSKMSMTDPKQKLMIYFMPIFMIFIFYSLPSGLNLYYAVFNLLSMAQTRYIKKKTHPGNGGSEQPAEVSTPARQGKPRRKKK
ncbi:MAG: membrane protein insertase YidC [Calditrichaeota bacterium]|nr:membrane protein insertase YidC [Calditrichota bacterium]RQW08350.1 MAG: membrane protein insertase YidC [Calditrichota bacterium]